MDTWRVGSWEEYVEKVAEIHRLVRAKRGDAGDISRTLFRGQSNSSWALKTTLDRAIRSPMPVKDYFRVLAKIKPQMETFTGLSWEFDRSAAQDWSSELARDVPPGYDFMVYLRHHGFPSPLLDWTASPNIAAFFAFRDVSPEVETVSVYAFCEWVTGARISSSDHPSVIGCGPNVRGHPRHFLQKAQYTICTWFQETERRFAHHDEAVVGANEGKEQDWMWKIDIPASERGKVLRHLADFNLNPFSLFGSTESLAETLALAYFGPVTNIGPDYSWRAQKGEQTS